MLAPNPRIVFLFVLIVSLTVTALAQSPNKETPPTPSAPAALEAPPAPTSYVPASPRQSPAMQNSAAASFEHVVELTGQLDQRMLTTVYWCLGTLVGVFLLLI